MKVLYISEFFYEVNGAHQLSMMHYEILKKIIGEENVITVALTGGEKIDDNKYIKFQAYSSRKEKLRNFLQLNTPRINNKIIKEIEIISIKENIDIIFVDNSVYGRFVKFIKSKYKHIKIISFYHDVKRNLYKEWLLKNGIKFIPDYICGIYNEYINQKYSDYNITLNERENKVFKKYYKHNSSLKLPIILKSNDEVSEFVTNPTNIKLLFVGAYYYPNVIGIKWFIKNVMPKIYNRYQLNIIGRGMEKLQDEIKESRVNVIGSVDDISKYYKEADVIIAPIFDGAGMKVKTAEAFSYGKMFIGTKESLEGYLENIPKHLINRYIFECEKDLEFIEILNNLEISNIRKYNCDIKKMFDEFYSQEAAIKILKDILK